MILPELSAAWQVDCSRCHFKMRINLKLRPLGENLRVSNAFYGQSVSRWIISLVSVNFIQ
jgi:hypothetical protein